jgi:hypothetical protein
MPQEYGLIGEKIKAKVFENQGKVSFAFGIAPILDQVKEEISATFKQPDATPQDMQNCLDVLRKWFGEI